MIKGDQNLSCCCYQKKESLVEQKQYEALSAFSTMTRMMLRRMAVNWEQMVAPYILHKSDRKVCGCQSPSLSLPIMIENQNSKAYFAIYAVRKNGMQHTDSKTPQARRAARTALEESSGDIEEQSVERDPD